MQQQHSTCEFNTSDSWVILSPIEQSIKRKIEAVGTPLKDWDIQIYRGVLTGYNEAFIISTEKRNEILSNCLTADERSRTEELIRPILRGRDIKRYGYDWAGLWLIYIPWHFPYQFDSSITGASEKAERAFKEQYPAVYAHMLQYKEPLSKRNKAETGIRYEWYAMQRWGAKYWDDFRRPKVIYPETTQGAYFAFDESGFYIDKTCFMLISNNSEYLQLTLSSKLFAYSYKNIFSSVELGEHGYQYNKHALIKVPIKIPNAKIKLSLNNNLDEQIYELYHLDEEEINFIESQQIR